MKDAFHLQDLMVVLVEHLKLKNLDLYKVDGQKNLLSIYFLYLIIYKLMLITKILILNHLELDMFNLIEHLKVEEEHIEHMVELLLI